jgi:hypothetical protein
MLHFICWARQTLDNDGKKVTTTGGSVGTSPQWWAATAYNGRQVEILGDSSLSKSGILMNCTWKFSIHVNTRFFLFPTELMMSLPAKSIRNQKFFRFFGFIPKFRRKNEKFQNTTPNSSASRCLTPNSSAFQKLTLVSRIPSILGTLFSFTLHEFLQY